MKIDNRLKAIILEINGENLLDIGCDHGKVLVSALIEGRVRHATGVDISAKSADKARALATLWGVNADFIVGDGRDVLFQPYDVVVIAGLGGNEMVEILKGRDLYPKTLILVPHQDKDVLRRFLNQIKYYPAKDYTVQAGAKFYDIIVAKSGGVPYCDEEFFYGKNFPKTSAFLKKVQQRAQELAGFCCGNAVISNQLKAEWEAYQKWLQ